MITGACSPPAEEQATEPAEEAMPEQAHALAETTQVAEAPQATEAPPQAQPTETDSPRHQEWIHIDLDDGKKLSAWIVYPESSEAADSIVVIHDIRAMSEWIRDVGDQIAAAGYMAIVPDLLSGMGPDGGDTDSFGDRREVGQAIRALDDAHVTKALNACVDYVRALPSTTDAVSVGGFCWGGRTTFMFATNEPSLKAAYVFYGSPPEKEAMANITCPVYGFYGENDNRINSTLEETGKNMTELGKTFEPLMYMGVGHGFLRSGMGDEADEMEVIRTAEAWERWITLLGQ
jgi:carboxymethylenebutenolidase